MKTRQQILDEALALALNHVAANIPDGEEENIHLLIESTDDQTLTSENWVMVGDPD